MFCKNCGKDIKDGKFCPHCGTKVLDTEDDVVVGVAIEDNATQENEKKENSEKKISSQKKAEKESVNIGKHEPTKDTKSFEKRLKEECIPYKVFDILDTIRSVLQIAIPIVIFLISWLLNKNEKFGYILLNTIVISIPVELILFIAGAHLGVILLIIFIVQMNKKKASNKELFRCVYFEDGDYSMGVLETSGFDAWQAISFKYNKSTFVVSIIQKIIYIASCVCDFLFLLIWAISALPISREYGFFIALQESVSINSGTGVIILIILVPAVLMGIVTFIMRIVRNNLNKKLAEKFKAGELE